MELKNSSESDVKLQRKKLHEAIEGRVVLKSMLSRGRTYSSSSSDSAVANVDTKRGTFSYNTKRNKFTKVFVFSNHKTC